MKRNVRRKTGIPKRMKGSGKRVTPRKIGNEGSGLEVKEGKDVEAGFAGKHSATRRGRKRLGIPSMDIPTHLPKPEVARLIPLEVAREFLAVPLAVEEGVLTVALASPGDCESVEALARISGHRVFPVLSTPEQLEAALQRLEALCCGHPCEKPSG